MGSVVERLAPNLDRLWLREPLPQRFARAAAAGFRAVETLYPQRDVTAVDDALSRTGLQLVLFNAGARVGPRDAEGLLAVPGAGDAFARMMRRDLELARRWGVPLVHALAGAAGDDVAGVRTAIQNLRQVADTAAAAGVTVLVEYINRLDRPGYGLPDFATTVDVVERVAHPSVGLQFDYYHLSRAGVDPERALQHHIEHVRHVQIAQPPSRTQPTSDSRGVLAFLDLLDELGYQGYVGLEYDAPLVTGPTFDWIPPRRPRG